MKFKISFLAVLMLLAVNASAQSLTFWGIEQGLSNSTVNAIYKDHHGFMWFGTFDGLNRFDGYSFTKFRNHIGDTTSIPDGFVNALEEDSEGNLWVATKKGVGILNNKTFKFLNVRYKSSSADKSKSSLITTHVNFLKADSKGNIFIATAELGLMVAPKGERVAVQIPLNLDNNASFNYSVYAITADKDDNLWLLTDKGGLCRYNSQTKKIIAVNPEISDGNCIRFDKKGNLWMGTNSGLFWYDQKTQQTNPFVLSGINLSENRIFDISFEKEGKLWIVTDDGIFVCDTRRKNLVLPLSPEVNKALSNHSINKVFIDGDSRKWIGTKRAGIIVIDSKKNYFGTVKHEPYNINSLIHNTVMSFCEDGDDIWIGTDGGGLSIWNRKLDSFKHHAFAASSNFSSGANSITSIIKDDEQNIWIGTYGTGVKIYNKKTGSFNNIPFKKDGKGAYVWKLYMDADKNIWAGCIKGRWAGNLKKGLFKFDRKTNQFISTSYPVYEEVLSITDDNAGNLWVGTLQNLLQVNKKSSKVKRFHLDTYVRALHADKNGKLWVGTDGKGLWAFNRNSDKFKVCTEEEGLPSNIVVNIEEDKAGYIWLSTYNGLSRLNPQTSSFENFNTADGLQSNQFYYNASARLSSGELLFGGIKGFNIFNPKSIAVYKGFPPVLITGMKVLNTPVTTESEFVKDAPDIYNIEHIVLPYEKSMFSLDFVALEYSLPDKIQYAYYLKGWDKTWNYINNLRNISYSRLNEGTYTLEIRSTNASGIWNTKGKIIKITVLPPWYRSWWAYFLYVCAVGSAVYAYVYYQKQKALLQFEVKLATLKAAQETELNEKKISFFTNIAHELRTPLTLIVNPIKDLLNNDGKNVNLVDISAVYRNTRRLLSLVDQLLLFKKTENEVSDLKPEVLNLEEVCNEVFLCFTNQVKTRTIDYRFENFTESLLIFADREKIEIVLFNLLSNAIKYSRDKGAVTLILNEVDGHAELLVKNTGAVIPEQIGEKLFDKFYRLDQTNTSKKSGFGIGLFISKKIAEKQGGTLSYVSNLEEGTIFRYCLPKNMDNVSEENLHTKTSNTQLLEELLIESSENDLNSKATVSESMTRVYEGIVENKPNVLLVDDDAEIRAYVRQILKNNYNIFEAESAEQGWDELKKSEPDIIVSDIVMQGMSGVEFCSKIKESKEFSHIPVILLTGTSSPEVKLKGIECGADDYLTKPFENELLIARVKSILKGRDSLKRYFFNEVTLQNNNEKVSEEYSTFLKKCMEIVEEHLQDDQFNVKGFVKEMGMSHSNVFRKVKSISGLSISEFIRYIRLKKAAELMIQTDIQVKEVAYKVGIQDPRYFREQFSKIFGLNPSEYIKKYRRTFLRAPGS